MSGLSQLKSKGPWNWNEKHLLLVLNGTENLLFSKKRCDWMIFFQVPPFEKSHCKTLKFKSPILTSSGEMVWWRGDRIPTIFNLPWVWEVSAQVSPDRLRFTKQIKATTTTQIMKPTETMAMMYLYCELVFIITCWGFLVLLEWTCWSVAERNSKGKSGLWTTFSEDIFLLSS